MSKFIKKRKIADTLANFLIGEGKLESYLEENPPTEANIPKAKTGLADARKYLLLCIGEPAKKVRRKVLDIMSFANLYVHVGLIFAPSHCHHMTFTSVKLNF